MSRVITSKKTLTGIISWTFPLCRAMHFNSCMDQQSLQLPTLDLKCFMLQSFKGFWRESWSTVLWLFNGDSSRVSLHPSCQTVWVLRYCQLNCNHTSPCGSCSHARSSLTDQRACDDGSHGFHHKLIGVSARLNLKAFDPRALYPIGVILARQISPLAEFLPAVREQLLHSFTPPP